MPVLVANTACHTNFVPFISCNVELVRVNDFPIPLYERVPAVATKDNQSVSASVLGNCLEQVVMLALWQPNSVQACGTLQQVCNPSERQFVVAAGVCEQHHPLDFGVCLLEGGYCRWEGWYWVDISIEYNTNKEFSVLLLGNYDPLYLHFMRGSCHVCGLRVNYA
eukprot:TRINITY_DN33495_c0_g2_i1.p2 TRINITY_DN33495_c0_g2~~TRINITY_DN33495_c0_g2_i1.p2  ORF type:complete len:165 (+),score=6.99 TRINITY_DN33495_c0_g2_i1:782-1276(+)